MAFRQKKINLLSFQKKVVMFILAVGVSNISFCSSPNDGVDANRGLKKAISASKIKKDKEEWTKDQGGWFNPYFTEGMPMPYRIRNSYK